ncbi:MAG: DUF4339 domain-containing protein [Planctomycetia bacterium]|nr:DUF4339 domain-containing protein [Planctomycetia bacterium]
MPSVAVAGPSVKAPPAASEVPGYAIEPDTSAAAPTGQTWYYTSGGAQLGPVDFAFLQKLAATGQLGPSNLVWTEGMAEWAAPGAVPGLNAPPATGRSATANVATESGNAVTPGVCRALAGSRRWILFLAIVTFVYCGFYAVLGVWAVVFGFSSDIAAIVGEGLFFLSTAAVGAAAGVLLLFYANRIGVLQFRRDFQQLESTLEAARWFWVYAGIIQIAFLIFLSALSVWAMAVGGATVRASARSLF